MSSTALVSTTAPAIHLPQACRLLAQTESIAEAKELRDQASTIQEYLRTRREGLDRQNDAAELKLRAERRLGELLGSLSAGGGRRLRDESTGKLRGAATTLPEGITHIQSHRWQRIAALPEPAFEQWIQATRSEGEELTQADLLRVAERYIRSREVELELADGGAPDEETSASPLAEHAPEPVYTRSAVLYLTHTQYRRFHRWCTVLGREYRTNSLTDTVFECVRRVAEGDE
jgi:hypothetical protein